MGFTIISIVIISIVGTLSHFMYDISKHNKFVGLFAAVNESTWEHIKIALTPTLLWSIVDGLKYGMNGNYFYAKLASLVVIIFLMPTLFYGYKFFYKKDFFILNILIFYIVIISSQFTFYYLIDIKTIDYIYQYLSCIGVFILFGGYLIHTTLPAKNFLFKDPISNKYGYSAHTELKK